MRPMMTFAFASLLPAFLLVLASGFGGIFPFASVLSITVVVFILDRISNVEPVEVSADSGHDLSLLIGVVHFVVLPMSICGIAQAGHLSTLDRLLIFICAGLWLGQVSNSNAHELFHRSSSGPRQLGVAIYCSLLFGHYASAHPKVHYVYVATDRDPNSAQSGEGFYRFLIRAWLGGFHEGLVAKTLHLGGKASTVTLVSSLCWIHSRWGFDSFCLFGHRRVYRPRQAVGPCSRCADPVVSVR